MKTAGLRISTVCYVHYLLVTIYIYIYIYLYVLLVKTAGFIVMMSLNVRNTLWRYALVLCKDLLIECILDQFEVG